jgi:hypothetical protein
MSSCFPSSGSRSLWFTNWIACEWWLTGTVSWIAWSCALEMFKARFARNWWKEAGYLIATGSQHSLSVRNAGSCPVSLFKGGLLVTLICLWLTLVYQPFLLPVHLNRVIDKRVHSASSKILIGPSDVRKWGMVWNFIYSDRKWCGFHGRIRGQKIWGGLAEWFGLIITLHRIGE